MGCVVRIVVISIVGMGGVVISRGLVAGWGRSSVWLILILSGRIIGLYKGLRNCKKRRIYCTVMYYKPVTTEIII